MEHFLIQPNEQGIVHAAKIIQTGGLVAFPTETVYGLGANALNEEAVKSIFTAKGRPLTDPLIVHIAEPEQSYELVDLSQDEMIVFQLLIARFWPGPLTVIVKSSSKIPLLVTANTGFVGVRCPKHPLAVSLLKASGLPIAAPSANRFGHVSPTTAAHVLADLGCKGVHVLNGEYGFEVGNDTQELISNCEYGIESSVVKIDLDSRQLIIFRQGAVNQQQLEHCLQSAKSRIGAWRVTAIQRAVKMSHTEVSAPTSSEGKTSSEEEQQEILAGQQAPGQAITHYAPDVPCYIVQKVTTVAVASGASIHEGVLPLPLKQLSSSELKSCAVLVDFHGAFGELRESSLAYRDLSVVGSSSEAARSLFDTLRWSEGVPGAKYVFIAAIPEIVSESASCAYRLREDGGDVRTDTSAGDAGAADMTLGLVDRIFRAASGVAVELVVWQ